MTSSAPYVDPFKPTTAVREHLLNVPTVSTGLEHLTREELLSLQRKEARATAMEIELARRLK